MTKSDDGGAGYVERVGWVPEDQQHPKRFTATVVFPDGPPSLPVATVWRRTPVYLVLATPTPTPQPAADAISWRNWRGAIESYDEAVLAAVKNGVEEKAARNVLWLAGVDHMWKHIAALRTTPVPQPAADAGAEPEPVAWMLKNEVGSRLYMSEAGARHDASRWQAEVVPLYAAPPPGAAPQPAPDQVRDEAVAAERKVTEAEVEAACAAAANNGVTKLSEVAIRSWAYYEGVPDAKHESTKLRHAYMTGFLAAAAAARARSTPTQDAPEPVADRAAEPADGEGIIKSLASRLRYAADSLDKGLGDRDAHWADIHGVADTLARLSASRGVSEAGLGAAVEWWNRKRPSMSSTTSREDMRAVLEAYETARATTEAR